MPAGFQVFGEHGVLQVDGTFKNMVLTGRGTLALVRPNGIGVQPYPQAAYARIPYPVSSRQPVLALRSNANVCFLTDDNGFTLYGGTVGTTVDYYIYDRVDFGAAAGNAGVQVFNEQGAEVFNSNNSYMKVLGSYNVEIGPVNPTNGVPPPTYSGSVPGRTIAVCMGVQSTGYYVEGIGTPQQPAAMIRYWQCQAVTPSASNFTLTNGVISAFGGPILATPGLSGSISPYNSGLLIDVTGI